MTAASERAVQRAALTSHEAVHRQVAQQRTDSFETGCCTWKADFDASAGFGTSAGFVASAAGLPALAGVFIMLCTACRLSSALE